jgi:hypothetical protein
MRGLPALLALVLLACEETPPRAPTPREECSPGIFGIEAYDALYDFPVGGRPAIFATSPDDLRAAREELRERVVRAAAVDPSPLRREARIVLQNDAWGLYQRVENQSGLASLKRPLAALVRRLALGSSERSAARIGIATAARRVLDPNEGWREVGTEMPVFSHERAFGLRRIFHVVLRESARALTSQLVALDAAGHAYASDVPGDLEILGLRDDRIVAARLFELDRRALRCRGAEHALEETDRVRHVPDLGAHSFFLELDPPEPVASLPCARCHSDGEIDSLPDPSVAPEPRLARLVSQAGALAQPIFREEAD